MNNNILEESDLLIHTILEMLINCGIGHEMFYLINVNKHQTVK